VTSSNATLSVSYGVTTDYTVNRAIPDASFTGVSDTRILSTAIQSVTNLQVRLKISGTYNGDLFCYLTHGSGYSVLLNRVGRTASSAFGYDDDGLDVTFEDGPTNDVHGYRVTLSGNPNTPLGTSLTGTWVADGRTTRPTEVLDTDARLALLNVFTNQDPNGSWTIFVGDVGAGDGHTLVSWGLEISGTEAPSAPVVGPDVYDRPPGVPLKIKLADLLANDVGDSIAFAGLELVSTNGVTVTTNATTIFYANANNVDDRLTYNIRDNQAATASGYVLIQMAGVTSTNSVVRLQRNVPGANTNTLTLVGIPNYQYVVQFATNTTDSPWFNLSTNTAGSNGLWTVLDSTATNEARSYRVRTP
jgi:subtilisin-like proprotein convertase family protein